MNLNEEKDIFEVLFYQYIVLNYLKMNVTDLIKLIVYMSLTMEESIRETLLKLKVTSNLSERIKDTSFYYGIDLSKMIRYYVPLILKTITWLINNDCVYLENDNLYLLEKGEKVLAEMLDSKQLLKLSSALEIQISISKKIVNQSSNESIIDFLERIEVYNL